MSKHKILVITPMHEQAMTMLSNRDDIEYEVLNSVEEDDIVKAIADADGVTVRTAKITRRIIEAGKSLKVIARHGVGYDNVDLQAASDCAIPVTITIDANADSVAEQTLAFILGLAKQVTTYSNETKAGNWMKSRSEVKTRDIAGSTLMIMGVGRIGSRLAPRAAALGMKVKGYDPAYTADELGKLGVEPVSDWRGELPNVDFLTLHCPRQADTENLVDASVLNAMKPSAFVINCARGGLVNESDLNDALSRNTIAGAALDVFDVEPAPADHPLLSQPNLIVSPHSSAASEQGMIRMGEATVRSIFDAMDGQIPEDTIVNRAQL